jgi:hypothetical protein
MTEHNNKYNNASDGNNAASTTTVITFSLPDKYYKVGMAISVLLGYDSFEDYVNHAVKQNIFMQLDGAGSLNVNDIDTRKLLMEE